MIAVVTKTKEMTHANKLTDKNKLTVLDKVSVFQSWKFVNCQHLQILRYR